MNVMGLDLSLTATGVACASGHVELIESKEFGMARLRDIRERIVDCVNDEPHPDLAVIEGYSFASENNRERLGELGGVIRLMLFSHEIPYVEVAPGTLKKFATGSGKAKKDQMIGAAIRSGYNGIDNNNTVDAWFLRELGLYNSGESKLPVTNYREECIQKVKWPL